MPYTPTNINYTSKDFSTIKADLIEYTKSYFPNTYKDFNETSPGMMLIELSSYVGDVLSYYVDYNFKENVLVTATEKRNVRRLAEFLGYKTPNKTPSVVRLKVTTDIGVDSNGYPDYSHANVVRIPTGLQIKSNIDSELLFETTGDGEKIDNLIELLQPYRISEISRTGKTAISKGSIILKNIKN